jgi:hypothetical protein
MFSSRARACYPESSRSDGCFPDNDTTPSRFKCWVDGSPDSPGLFDLVNAFSARDRTPPAPDRAPRRGWAGRGKRR